MNVVYWVFVFSFDVGRSMFDVRRSSFKTTLYGINATCERLHNNLALMGIHPRVSVSATYHSGTPRIRFWILDLYCGRPPFGRDPSFGFLSTVNDIELTVQISRLFFDSHELFSRFSFRNPRSAIRIRRPGGPPASPERAGSRWRAGTLIITVSQQQLKLPAAPLRRDLRFAPTSCSPAKAGFEM